MGLPGQGHGSRQLLPQGQGARRPVLFLHAVGGYRLQHPRVFVQEMQDTAVGLENLGAAQGDALKQFPQVQGGADGHSDGMEGVQLRDSLLGLQRDLTAPNVPASCRQITWKKVFLLVQKLARLFRRKKANTP